MSENKILVISGPSGVGKTTIYKKLLQEFPKKIGFSVSATTRKIRDGEVEGKDYIFLSEEEFEYLIAKGDFIEWEQVHNHYYGTLKSEIYRIWEEDKHCLLDIDVRGGLRIHKTFGDKSHLIFISPPSMEVLENRLRSRGTNDEVSLQNRLHNAVEEMEQKTFYDLVLKNEDLEQTFLALKNHLRNLNMI